MISITHLAELSNEFTCPIIDRETEQYGEKEQASAERREMTSVRVEFDLFAEARRIYARSRSRRVRSSNII